MVSKKAQQKSPTKRGNHPCFDTPILQRIRPYFGPYTKATLASTLIPILGLEQRKKKYLNTPLKKVEPNKPYSLTLLAPPF